MTTSLKPPELNEMLKILKIIDTAIIYDVENVSSATRYLKELAVALHEFLGELTLIHL